MVKADLHNHLRTSSNLKEGDFDKAIDIASQRLGENGIFAMTNFEDSRYEQFTGLRGYDRTYIGENKNAIYVPEKQILVVKAQEVPTKKGHFLALGLGHNQHLKSNQTLEDTIQEAINFNAIKIADHPFFIAGIGPYLENHPELIGLFDAIETHNGEAIYGNSKSERFYNSLGWNHYQNYYQLGALSSSDGHSFHELGTSWTEIDFPNITNSKEFIPTLKKSIKSTDLQTNQKNKISYRGAIEHMVKLAFITQINNLH